VSAPTFAAVGIIFAVLLVTLGPAVAALLAEMQAATL
jgi:hypothetical protein